MKPLWINGAPVDIAAIGAHETLLALLRHNGWTGAKCGCAEGDCGACSVLLLDERAAPRAINSCLALVHSLAGGEVWTAEGIGREGALHPVQQKMISCSGSQCGYCTPGFIAAMVEGYHRETAPAPGELPELLCGNLCRCTGYRAIREAMAEALAEKGGAPVPFPSHRSEAPPAAMVSSLPGVPGVYLQPSSLEELFALRDAHPGALLVAGATEIAVLVNKRHLRPPVLIGLEHVPELREIHRTDTEWSIGAGLCLTDVAAALAGEYPVLDQMFRVFASRQIRHRATLGGNLVTASPIGDSAPALLALDASVLLVSPQGQRRIALDDFFTGYRQTAMLPGEVMQAVILPRGLSGRSDFFKVSKRREMDISIVSAAFRVVTDEANLVTAARLAYGGVAALPRRAKRAEAALIGKPLRADEPFLRLLESEFAPLSDVRGTAAFRTRLIRGLFAKFCAASPPLPGPPIPSRFPPSQAEHHESARGHVTGRALYTYDQALRRGMLELWPVRSTEAHARLKLVDCSAATGMPGVRAVLLARDVPGINNVGPSRHDEPLLAEDVVQFRGQWIAAVVGETEEQCRHAAAAVRVEYEPLPAILGIETAIAAGSYHTGPHTLERGHAAAALADAPHRLDGTFAIGGQEHFYLETHAAWAEAGEEGSLHVVSSTQHPSEVQTVVAEVMGVPRHQVVVESPRMGGGFGGKETQGNAWAALCALAAKVTGRAVRLQLDRDLDIESTGKRHPFLARYRVGYDARGRLLAAEIELFSDGGWSLDLSQPVNDRALFHLDNAYYLPHAKFTGRVVKTHTTSHTAFRGFGGPQGMLVIEEILGRIALRLGLPPEEVRERNFYHGTGETNTTHYGADLGEPRLQRLWRSLLHSSDFAARRNEIDAWNASHRFAKRGLAITPVKFGISFTLRHYNQAGALLLIYQDGSVQVNHGGTEMGQGLHTKILGIAMRELGLPREAIRLMHTRTDKVPNTSATAASSGSDLNGMAVADACRKLRQRLAPVAAGLLQAEPHEVSFLGGAVHAGGKSLPFPQLVQHAYLQRVPLSATGFYATPDLVWDWNVRKGRPFHYYAYGAAVSEVEIDGFTGTQQVRRVDILHDVGDSLNPHVDRGQIEGGFVQGMGWLTTEELKWDGHGVLLTHSASTYAIPTIGDAPPDFRVGLLPNATQPGTIHGSKAVGEPPLMLAISVREALRDAVAAFGVPGDFLLPSPATGEALKLLIDGVR